MSWVKNNIPNFFTLANLTCGVLGIIEVFQGELVVASYLIWLAAAFDFLDGFMARILGATSSIGKQLDSLADLVTFGVVPGLIYFQLLQGKFELPLEYLCILVVLLSALRLAKFNIDDSQSTSFSGLPTPANAIFASAIPIILMGDTLLSGFFASETTLIIVMMISSFMMVVPITLISLKFTQFTLRSNIDKVMLIVMAGVLLFLFRESAIPMIISLYILISVFSTKNKNQEA